MDMWRSAGWLRVTLIVLALTSAVHARGQSVDVITNDDVVKMVRAEVSQGLILATIASAAKFTFDVSPSGLVALKQAGVDDRIVEAMMARVRASGTTTDASTRAAPEKSALLANSNDPTFILRNFKTILVDASKARFFNTEQMKGALGNNKNFRSLNCSLVDDRAVADVVLEVSYTFAWDYPFSLKHQNTSLVLVSGKGYGPFSGPLGADSVAIELVTLLKPYRVAHVPAKGQDKKKD